MTGKARNSVGTHDTLHQDFREHLCLGVAAMAFEVQKNPTIRVV